MKYFTYGRKSTVDEDRQAFSIKRQNDANSALIEADPEIVIVGHYEESQSAKTPGRPLFNDMMARLEAGEADGIISWHPDRLARNSIDGGRIIYDLDTGAIKDLKFSSFTFSNTADGKMLLNIAFTISKYQIDHLSNNVTSGMKLKATNGWHPSLPPIGYRPNKETKTIKPDKKHFKAIRDMYDLLFSGLYTPADIHRIICDQWGYTTPIRGKTGGKRPTKSFIYRTFENPFYAGYLMVDGELTPGKHKPIVSKEEFAQAQKILRQDKKPRKHKRTYAYTGLMNCAECNGVLTAEYKKKPNGREYTYYHCTRNLDKPKCHAKYIEERELEHQISSSLENWKLPDAVLHTLLKIADQQQGQFVDEKQDLAKQYAVQFKKVDKQLYNTTQLRIRDMMSDKEFVETRKKLTIERDAIEARIKKCKKHINPLEPARILILLCNKASFWFSLADNPTKRRLVKLLYSNPCLKDKKAILLAKKPLVQVGKCADFPRLCSTSEIIRTKGYSDSNLRQRIGEKLIKLATDPEAVALAKEAKTVIQLIDSDVLQ